MDYPIIFPLRERLAHRSPDSVRLVLRANWFRPHRQEHVPFESRRRRGFSEIWYRLAGRGYAAVRIDSQGHADLVDRDGNAYEIGGIAGGPHSAVPHYHKEWVPAELLSRYLEDYVPQVVRYNDAGDPVTGPMTDKKAKQIHIKQ